MARPGLEPRTSFLHFVAGVELRNLTTPTVRLFNHILKRGILEINKTIRKYIQSGQDNDT